MYVFNLYHIEYSIIVNHFRQYFDKKILPGITANFCSNNSDGRIWAFYSTYLTLDGDNPWIDLANPLCEKTIIVLQYLNGRL